MENNTDLRKVGFCLALILLSLCGPALADTQDYAKGKVILIRSNMAYFNVGQIDGVAVGEKLDIYYDQRVVASGKIAWADRNISRSEPLDSTVAADIFYYETLTVKVRLFVPEANRGGHLNIACFTDLHLDPATVSTPEDRMVARLIHRGLIAKDRNDQFVPDIAGHYEIRNFTYTFYIKPEAKFHSGKSIDSDDVLYSLEQLASASRLTAASWFVLEINGAEEFRNKAKNEIAGVFIIDKKILSITLKEPFPAFEDYLAGPGGYIVPRPGMVSAGTKTIGAGPYRIKWHDADGLVLEPNELVGDAAFLDSLRFLHFPSLEEAGLSFELGRLDMINLFGEAPPKFVTRGNFSSQNTLTDSYVILGINNTRDFQKDMKFGKALSFMLDRDAIIRVILGGSAARPMYLLPDATGRSVALSNPFLPDSAEYYLKSVETLPEILTLYVDSAYPSLTRVARYIEGQLLNKGIKVIEKNVDLALSDDPRIGSNLDIYLTCYVPVSVSPDCFFYPLYKQSLSGQTNFLYFNDEAIQTFLNDLHTETDPGRRDNLVYGIAQALTAEPAAVILYQPYLTVISKMDISGMVADPSGNLDMRRAFIEIR